MARIAGVNVPSNKRLVVALTYVKGIGLTRSRQVISEMNLSEDDKLKDLDEATINALRKHMESKFKLEGDLGRETLMNVRRLKEIRSYRGMRHAKRLPTRGQRTKTNSRTVRGNKRMTAGSGRVKAQKT
jgi:small subunit ribosomal protein S13